MKKMQLLVLLPAAFLAGVVYIYSCGGNGGSSSLAGVGDADTLDGLDSTDFALVGHSHPSGREFGFTTADGALQKNPNPPDVSLCSTGSAIIDNSAPSATNNWILAARYQIPADGLLTVQIGRTIVFDTTSTSPGATVRVDFMLRCTDQFGEPGSPDSNEVVMGSQVITLSSSGSDWNFPDVHPVLQVSFDTHSNSLVVPGSLHAVYLRAYAISGTVTAAFTKAPVAIAFAFDQGGAGVNIDP